ncbi:MAG: hypothetical protein F4Y45_11570 [Acidobacteria bacterium]|nr:hypothetical protein [Acidobacteriota bacterium]MYF30630.1 hypothetical protein [Gammaproteobacteria bacterium]MYJ02855.1 hypothetical protein [Acidobacteriota bacterium]
MAIDPLGDFANRANTAIGDFRVTVTLSPDALMAGEHAIPTLAWDFVSYGDGDQVDRVPADKRGIYAFAVCQANDVLPPHGYILYIGIAGRKSNRPLRDRYKDYLNEKKVLKRASIAYMIGTWRQVLRFYFAPVGDDVSSEDLETLEQQLNTALMPPFSKRDLKAEIRHMQGAFG